MKKIVILLVTFLSISAFAQPKAKFNQKPFKNRFTPQQNATLKTKHMALHLDLNAVQQKKVFNLILDEEIKLNKIKFKRQQAFKNGIRPTKEQLFNVLNKRLDFKLNFQNRLKNILNVKQYAEFKKGTFRRMAFNRKKKAYRKYRNHHPFERVRRNRF